MTEPQRILVTGDLHYGLYPQGDGCTHELARAVCGSGAEAFAIAGDVADADVEYFAACLALFEDFGGLKLVVPGNHDLWSTGAGSKHKYRKVLPELAEQNGFHMLDRGPATLGPVAFIGSIGWYDYSFRSDQLDVSMAHYERKELPGICTWNDARFIDWDYTDHEFTERCLHKLADAYRAVERKVETVVAVLHHLPLRELLYGPANAAHEFCRAYMGSQRFGELLLGLEKVRYVFCGHRHGADYCQKDGLEAFSVGSEYLLKRMVELNLATGKHAVCTFEPAGTAEKDRVRAGRDEP